jgi:hypothetical protein
MGHLSKLLKFYQAKGSALNEGIIITEDNRNNLEKIG